MRGGFLPFKTLFFLFFPIMAFGQDADTAYIRVYPQRIQLLGFVATNYVAIQDAAGDRYLPNYPITPGIGISVKNTALNVRLGYGVAPLKSERSYGRTKSIDLQMHKYWRQFMLDLSLQKYKGFYGQDDNMAVTGIYPDMSVLQIGAEGTYIFNGRQFSAKAAFDQGEGQIRSAGSFLVGGGSYLYRLDMNKNSSEVDEGRFDNFQLGINAGYAYSWAIGRHWLLSTTANLGANFGNEPELLKKGKVEIYPTASARFSSGYHRDDWTAGIAVFIGSRSIYPLGNRAFNLTSLTMQISFVRHLDKLFEKNKI